ncbi:hypothetical protein KFK09_024912 [Dendrobium nobile]|uniref:ABC transporter domain-containing protein n=1 Tax=Dendrobium nobile TaxID=94219 RepID=A0A8T3AF28_DENNO|nr:hypothetical protein KFK09_024912 [Dendrobium nobile]
MASESQSCPLEMVTVDREAQGGCPDVRVGVGSEGAGGVELTWEDLWVTTSKGNGPSAAILSGITGFARPGEVLAIMGPSGCGKSTLLDALSVL